MGKEVKRINLRELLTRLGPELDVGCKRKEESKMTSWVIGWLLEHIYKMKAPRKKVSGAK